VYLALERVLDGDLGGEIVSPTISPNPETIIREADGDTLDIFNQIMVTVILTKTPRMLTTCLSSRPIKYRSFCSQNAVIYILH